MNREDFDKIYEKVTAKKKYTFDELEDSYKDLKRKAIAANIIIGVIILLFICSFAYMIFFKGLEVKMWIYIALLIFCILLQFGINIYFKNYQLMMCDNYDVEYKENNTICTKVTDKDVEHFHKTFITYEGHYA
jgi:cell division protein FtsW (lipid II flippase)